MLGTAGGSGSDDDWGQVEAETARRTEPARKGTQRNRKAQETCNRTKGEGPVTAIGERDTVTEPTLCGRRQDSASTVPGRGRGREAGVSACACVRQAYSDVAWRQASSDGIGYQERAATCGHGGGRPGRRGTVGRGRLPKRAAAQGDRRHRATDAEEPYHGGAAGERKTGVAGGGGVAGGPIRGGVSRPDGEEAQHGFRKMAEEQGTASRQLAIAGGDREGDGDGSEATQATGSTGAHGQGRREETERRAEMGRRENRPGTEGGERRRWPRPCCSFDSDGTAADAGWQRQSREGGKPGPVDGEQR